MEDERIALRMVDMASLAAGGRAIAWIDSLGVLRVGPNSAAAKPGPACYGLGGSEPAITDANGVAAQTFSTANRLDSSGFLGSESSRLDKPSYYTFQVYYPGGHHHQPSRNDCGVLITNSTGPADPLNTRMKIIQVDTSGVGTSGKVRVIYQILDKAGNRVATGEQYLGKAQGFYADDPNWQTLPVLWITGNWHAAFNNVTVSGVGNPIPGAPQGLK